MPVSEKGGEFVVMRQALNEDIVAVHLKDKTIYVPPNERKTSIYLPII